MKLTSLRLFLPGIAPSIEFIPCHIRRICHDAVPFIPFLLPGVKFMIIAALEISIIELTRDVFLELKQRLGQVKLNHSVLFHTDFIFMLPGVLFCVSGANKDDVLSLLAGQLEVELSHHDSVKIR